MEDLLDFIWKVMCTDARTYLIFLLVLVFAIIFRERKTVKKEHVFCKDCTHFIPHPCGRVKYATCSKFPQNLKVYLVSGDVSHKECRYCSILRENENRCGVDGKFFEKKEEMK
jgi:hypothetical protein